MVDAEHHDPWEALRGLPMGRRVELTDGRGRTWSGTIVPRHELSGERVLQLKLDSGYNVGIRVAPTWRYRELETEAPPPVAPGPLRPAERAPETAEWVALLTTGGTIASRVDYETGGVRPVKEEREILAFYPELEAGGRVRIVPVFDRLSEDMTPDDWAVLATHVVAAFGEGAVGVVIAHGTDTLAFTSAALSFLLQDLPGPVVLVGAQRSPDRPSSDGPSNLAAAVEVARSANLGEVVVVMHAGLSDGRYAIHRGTWVRKMHSSRRDAFQSRNGPPVGYVDATGVHLERPVRPASAGPPRVDGPLDASGGLLWSYPGLSPARAEAFARDLRGLVLAGTGLGHVASSHLEWIRRATTSGKVIAMTTQTLAGNVDPFVYATGRELQQAGVLYLGDLLPEVALAKLCWALGHANDPRGVEALLLADLAGEFQWRHRTGGDP
ncbi:MAG TPA: Glu-tRNA(Gln) amidotransferase subunit GatD [Thermoplasmata archaeon]|nr:Glu-tRNA(Gln) amidotransferase subunit GatD [Thermoplasmata archaeon]